MVDIDDYSAELQEQEKNNDEEELRQWAIVMNWKHKNFMNQNMVNQKIANELLQMMLRNGNDLRTGIWGMELLEYLRLRDVGGLEQWVMKI